MKICIGIASYRRKELLSESVEWLERQTRPADRIIISVADKEDVDPSILKTPRTEILLSGNGSCVQRNGIIDQLSDEEIILFLDDDFVPQENYLELLETTFLANPEVVGTCGNVLADGAIGKGISFPEALEIIASRATDRPSAQPLSQTFSTYGCNMAFRTSAIRALDLRFDERLALYGWLEDVDFSRQIQSQGSVMKNMDLRGVHLGIKRGRTSGLRLGYSQVVNPFYLARKKSVSLQYAFKYSIRNTVGNFVKFFVDSAYIDRWGRLRGNMLGFFILLTSGPKPERVSQI